MSILVRFHPSGLTAEHSAPTAISRSAPAARRFLDPPEQEQDQEHERYRAEDSSGESHLGQHEHDRDDDK